MSVLLRPLVSTVCMLIDCLVTFLHCVKQIKFNVRFCSPFLCNIYFSFCVSLLVSILLSPLVSTVCILINLLDCLVPGGAGFRLLCHHFCTCIGFIRVNVSEDTFDSEHLPDPTKTTVEGRGKIYMSRCHENLQMVRRTPKN